MHQGIQRAWCAALLALALLLSACGGGGSSGQPPTETIGQVVRSSVRADANGFSYEILVYLPPSYDTGTALLPAIYVTEGDAPYGAGISRFDNFKQAMQRRGTQAILVGLSGTARRNTDFLLPEASKYLDFIARQLAPAIERQYRADPKRRALSGLSHGGYFVVAALVLEGQAGTPSFSHYLSTESSYGAHAGPSDFLAFEKQLDTAGARPLPTTLFLAGAVGGNGSIMVDPLHAQMASHAHPGLTLLKSLYANTSHVGADLPAFEEALTRFFP